MSNESGVLFVNKCARSKSLSRSNGAERARIFSHVQRNPPGQPAKPTPFPEERTYAPRPASGWQIVPFGNLPSKNTKPNQKCKTRRNQRAQGHCSSGSGSSSTANHSPLSTIGLIQFDPFETTAAPITPYMRLFLDFYSGSILDCVFPNKSLADTSRQCTMSYASQDAIALNAILLTTVGTLYSYCGYTKYGLHAMYFKGEAIQHLKSELSKTDGSTWKISTLFGVSLLLWVECLQGDESAVEAHTKGLDFLVARVGGLDQSPVPIMTTILSCHYYCSAMLQTRPTLRPMTLSDDALSQSTTESLHKALGTDLGYHCSRFFWPSPLALLGQDLSDIILKQQRCLHFNEFCSEGLLTPTANDIEHMYVLQIVADFELLDLPYHTPLTPVQEAAVLALYVIAQPLARIAPTSSGFSRSMAKQMRIAVERLDAAALLSSTLSAELFLWIVFVALYISAGQEEWPVLITYMATTVETLDIETESEMEKTLSGFVYLQKFCGDTLERAWKDSETLRMSEVDH